MTPQEQAAAGVGYLKAAILDYLASHREGARHSDIVQDLGLQSHYEGANRNYLSWSVLGLLIAEGRVRYEGSGKAKTYFRC